MMLNWRIVLVVSFLVVVMRHDLSFSESVAESKIKNGKILAEKALDASPEQKADFTYKAKREFERATLAEPENPWPYYWEAVATFYLESDSAGADKLYRKALGFDARQLEGYPAPWAYRSDQNLKAAFRGDIKWAGEQKAPEKPPPPIAPPLPVTQPPPVLVEKPKAPERPTDPLPILGRMIESKELLQAESLYADLNSRPDFKNKADLLAQGVILKIAEDSVSQASSLLSELEKSGGRRSPAYKKAVSRYETVLDSVTADARRLERQGEFADAESALVRWEPYRKQPATPSRGQLLLLHSSAVLSQNRLSEADSALRLYADIGYEKNQPYKSLKSRLEMAQKQLQPEKKKVEIARVPEIKAPQPVENYVTIAPPKGEIVKVVINTLDPSTGVVQSSDLWETASPTKLKTGASYKLVVQKKQEAKAPRFIALAGILATFILVR